MERASVALSSGPTAAAAAEGLHVTTLALLGGFLGQNALAQAAFQQTDLIFPVQDQHAHGSTLVELPNGDLLVGWFQGSGERWAYDVVIQAL